MKAPILSSLLISLLISNSQGEPPIHKITPRAPTEPLPEWTKSKATPSASLHQIKFETKLIEISSPKGDPAIPKKRYQKKLTDEQKMVYIRALSQKKGTDVMSSPSLVTKEGDVAKIEVIRELIYPMTKDEKTFEKEELGVIQTFRVQPVKDKKSLTINALIQVKQQEGFQEQKDGHQLPIIKERRFDEEITLAPGETVILGGLLSTSVQQVEDRVPYLSKLPYFGGMFTTQSTETFTTELIAVITATLIDPTGKPVR